ncbi:hypothetical protein BC629DRAFT_920368 [Irpex lacteus]|nr:hypothetical protein BC629DRAFT_920368 [Irpex lacteus]
MTKLLSDCSRPGSPGLDKDVKDFLESGVRRPNVLLHTLVSQLDPKDNAAVCQVLKDVIRHGYLSATAIMHHRDAMKAIKEEINKKGDTTKMHEIYATFVTLWEDHGNNVCEDSAMMAKVLVMLRVCVDFWTGRDVGDWEADPSILTMHLGSHP